MEEIRKQVALQGNGRGEEVSDEQLEMVKKLYDDEALKPFRTDMLTTSSTDGEGDASDVKSEGWLNYEVCRRFLVARGWVYKDALNQLLSASEWRVKTRPNSVKFEDSVVCAKNPYALNMRCVGYSDDRPVMYTCFSQANDRYNTELNIQYLTALLEEAYAMICKRIANGLNKTAASRQWVWIIDFDGFGFYDQSPSSAMQTASLMRNYPEMLSFVALVDSPFLFSATWKVLQGVLDDRVRSKVAFVSADSIDKKLAGRLSDECLHWLKAEFKDNRVKRSKDKPKAYWEKPSAEGAHDPRGLPSYVDSEYYIRTPGDRHLAESKPKE